MSRTFVLHCFPDFFCQFFDGVIATQIWLQSEFIRVGVSCFLIKLNILLCISFSKVLLNVLSKLIGRLVSGTEVSYFRYPNYSSRFQKLGNVSSSIRWLKISDSGLARTGPEILHFIAYDVMTS